MVQTMRIDYLDKIKLELDFNIILCSLLTIAPYDNIFRQLTIAYGSRYYNTTSFYFPTQDFELLYSLINKKTIREFAFVLLDPLINIKTDNSEQRPAKEELLKTYLKKYQYNYKNYFLPQQGQLNQKPCYNELNQSAIQALFFIIGI